MLELANLLPWIPFDILTWCYHLKLESEYCFGRISYSVCLNKIQSTAHFYWY